jgi:hypothetical protein
MLTVIENEAPCAWMWQVISQNPSGFGADDSSTFWRVPSSKKKSQPADGFGKSNILGGPVKRPVVGQRIERPCALAALVKTTTKSAPRSFVAVFSAI